MKSKTTWYFVAGTVGILAVVLIMFAMGGPDYFNAKLEPWVKEARPLLGFPEVGKDAEGKSDYSPNSVHGSDMDAMIVYVHVLMVALLIGWSAYFIITLLKFRKSKNPNADHAGVTSKLPTTLAEFGVVAIEVVLIALFAVPLWGRVVNVDEFPSERQRSLEVDGWNYDSTDKSTKELKLSGDELETLDNKNDVQNGGIVNFKTILKTPAPPEDGPESGLFVLNVTSDEPVKVTITWGENERVISNEELLVNLWKPVKEKNDELDGIVKKIEDNDDDSRTKSLNQTKYEIEEELKDLREKISSDKLRYSQLLEIDYDASCKINVDRGDNAKLSIFSSEIRKQLAGDQGSANKERSLEVSLKTMPTIVIRVIAEQFEWNGLYSGYDGLFGKQDMQLITAGNKFGYVPGDVGGWDDFNVGEVIVPAGVKVITHISSRDVIHCFKVIPMRVCQDALPGLSIPVHFEPKAPLKSWINCAQLCGNGHAYMRGNFEVKSRKEFTKWWNGHAGWWNKDN